MGLDKGCTDYWDHIVCCLIRWFIQWTKQHWNKGVILVKSYEITWCLLMIFVCFVQVQALRWLRRILDVCQSGTARLMQNRIGLFSTATKLFVWRLRLSAKSAVHSYSMTLGGQNVKSVDLCKYLGIVLDTELSDDKDIQRQLRYSANIVQQTSC